MNQAWIALAGLAALVAAAFWYVDPGLDAFFAAGLERADGR